MVFKILDTMPETVSGVNAAKEEFEGKAGLFWAATEKGIQDSFSNYKRPFYFKCKEK